MLNFSRKHTPQIVIFITIAIFLLLSLTRCVSPELIFNRFHKDDAPFFYTMAHNLAVHGKYATNASTLFPFQPHGTWPPVWPMFLAAWIKFFSMEARGLTVINVLLSVANLWIFHRILTRHANILGDNCPHASSAANIALVATAFSPVYFCFSRTLMPEVFFLLLSNIALLGTMKSLSGKTTVTTALTTSLAFLTRGYAILLIPTFVLRTLTEKKKKAKVRITLAATFLLIAGFTVLGWSKYSKDISQLPNADYVTKTFGTTSQLFQHDSLVSFIKNDIYWRHLPSLGEISNPLLFHDVFNPPLSNFAITTGASFLLMSVFGILYVARRKEFTLPTWTLLNIVFIVLAGLTQLRYWINVYPYMFYFAAIAFLHVPELPLKLSFLRKSGLYCWLTAMIVAFTISFYTQHDDFYAEYYREYSKTMYQLREKLPGSTVIVHESPQKSFMTTHFNSINYLQAEQALEKRLVTDINKYVFVTPYRKRTDTKQEMSQLITNMGIQGEIVEIFRGKYLTVFKCSSTKTGDH